METRAASNGTDTPEFAGSLSEVHANSLRFDGYVKLDGVIPPGRVAAALRAINRSLGRGIDPADLPRFRASSYCPELQADPAITSLYDDTPLRRLAEAAIGAGRVEPVRSGQIALRFPEPTDDRPEPGAHIDGMYYPGNGVPEGLIDNFAALAGVLLSDVPEPFCGNLTVWPGTHAANAAYFRERGPQSLLEGMPRVPMPPPRQITGRAGDVILAHYLLSHGAAANVWPHVRYAVYFRLRRADHERTRWASMTDEWVQWEGMNGHARRAKGNAGSGT